MVELVRCGRGKGIVGRCFIVLPVLVLVLVCVFVGGLFGEIDGSVFENGGEFALDVDAPVDDEEEVVDGFGG